jgi:hypothetical protein
VNPPSSTQEVLFAIARRIGLDPSVNLSYAQAYELLGFMDQRLREAWGLYDFVDITTVEERAFRDDYDPKVCYSKGAVVWDPCSRLYYQALVSASSAPLKNDKVWMANASPAPRYIAWQQAAKLPIGTAFNAYKSHPYEDLGAIEILFSVSKRGLEFGNSCSLATVWLIYRYPYPGLGIQQWDQTLSYKKGDAVYQAPDSYVSLVDANLNHPPPDEAHWELFQIPDVFVPFVVQAAYADSLVPDGQTEKSAAELGKAYGFLTNEFDKQNLQQGQMQHYQVVLR